MRDRLPLYPGRVQLTPVSGQPNVYDMVRADQPTQEGDPLNKATFLQDTVSALFGKSNDAVPNDILQYIGQYALFGNHYTWKRRTFEPLSSPKLVESNTSISVSNGVGRYYADSYSADYETGVFTLVSPTYSNSISANVETRGHYWMPQETGTTLYYSSSSAEFSSSYLYADVYSALPVVGDWEVITSINEDEYPDGIFGGYEYISFGKFGNGYGGVQIETGSYVGTGKYGSSNPNSLTFGFEPKIVFIHQNAGLSNGQFYPYSLGQSYESYGYILFYSDYQSGSGFYSKLNDTTLNWYYGGGSNQAIYQLNVSGVQYDYFVIG